MRPNSRSKLPPLHASPPRYPATSRPVSASPRTKLSPLESEDERRERIRSAEAAYRRKEEDKANTSLDR